MMICYDKAFPEAARALALDGAEIICCMSAWPAARTHSTPELADDRWTRRFDLFDRARALENQVLWVSANQSGTFGSLRFVAQRQGRRPGRRRRWPPPAYERGRRVRRRRPRRRCSGGARRHMFHLRDRRPDTYATAVGA